MENSWTGPDFKLGMLGGGQLGRMFIQEALNYDVHVHCLDPDINAPCKNIAAEFTVGPLSDFDAVYRFGKDKQLITVEIENVNTDALKQLESEGIKVFPQPGVLEIIRDKGLQKSFYRDHSIPTAPFSLVNSPGEIPAGQQLPFVLKMRTGGYDGKGVQVVKDLEQIDPAFEKPCVVEEMIPFVKELSVIVARNEAGETAVYPVVECEFNPAANLVEFLFAPADISESIEKKAKEIAADVISKLNMVGLLAVELFLTADGQLLVNEIAPRPHNSGHHTIECNVTSQFEQHMRSILNAPLGSTRMLTPGVMINLLGEPGSEGKAHYEGLREVMKREGVKVHLYGKEFTKPMRKMGHVTIIGEDLNEIKTTGRYVLDNLVVREK